MNELNKNIRTLEREEKLLSSSKSALLKERRRKKITKEEYELHKKLRVKEEEKDRYHKEIRNKLREQKTKLQERKEQREFKREKAPIIEVGAIIVLLLTMLFMTNYTGITGFATYSVEQTKIISLKQMFNESTTIELNITNATSIRISGTIIGNGAAKVLLDINGTLFEILNEDTIKTKTANLITGFAIKDITNLTEVITKNETEETIILEEETESVEEIINATTDESAEERINETITEHEEGDLENNITEKTNITKEVFENITELEIQNISKINITPEITIEQNKTSNITENISTEIIANTSINITQNITTNISQNITQPDTLNISSATNITTNITESEIVNISDATNVTTNITQEVELIEENITTEIKVFEFKNVCVETCKLDIPTTKLIIILENTTLQIDEIIYTQKTENKPPTQIKEIEDINFFNKYTLNATEYFEDPEGEELVFDMKESEKLKTTIKGKLIIFETNITGKHTSYIYATDGENLVKSNTFTLTIGTETIENKTTNRTTTIEENTTQYKAEIGKPVKWKKTVKTKEKVENITIKLPSKARNITIKEEPTQKEVSKYKISVIENETRKTITQYENEKEIEELNKQKIKAEKENNEKESKEIEKAISKLKEETNLITGQVIIENEGKGILTRLLEKLVQQATQATITGNVINEINTTFGTNETIVVEEETIEEIIETENITTEKNSEEISETIIEEETKDENITIENQTTEQTNTTISETNTTTINITKEITSQQNETPINISTNITTNITEQTTENISEETSTTTEITTNITEQTTENISEETSTTTEITTNLKGEIIDVVEEVAEQEEIEPEETINETEEIITEINTTTTEFVAIKEDEIAVIIEHNASEYTIEYETEAPELIEEEVNKYKKIVTIKSDTHYTKILTYTNITPTPKENVALYWIKNGTKELFKNVTYIDANNDGLIEKLEWITPHLSNQTFEIIITVLNVQSYPMVGGDWTVMLNTTGQADLEITPYDLTTFLPEPTDENRNMRGDDLEFYDFKCGNESEKETVWITTPAVCNNNKLLEDNHTYCYVENNKTFVNYTELMQTALSLNITSIYLYNYTCNNTSYLIDIVRTAGAHHILFEFGPSNATAHNWAVKNATSVTVNATVSIRRPSSDMTAISGAYMYLDAVRDDTEKWHNTTWKLNYTKDCVEEGNYEVYVELLSTGNSGAEKDTSAIAEAITYWVTDCSIDGTGYTTCTVHAKSKNTNAEKDFGGRLELSSNCVITSVTGDDTDRYYTSDGQDTCSDPCGQYIQYYHTVSTADSTDETTFTIKCDDGASDNSQMLLHINETCGPSTCGEAIIEDGGFDACDNPICTDEFTYIGNDSIESIGGFDLVTYDIGIIDTWGWDTVTTYNIEYDADQSDCDCKLTSTACNSSSCYNNATNVIAFPDGGADYSSNCCGDDTNEYYNITGYNTTTLDGTPSLSDACCNASSSCVYSSTCYANNTGLTDVDSDGDNDYCFETIWTDCGTDSECQEGYTCNSTNDCWDISAPEATFISPTPNDGDREIANRIVINVSVIDGGNNIDSCWIEWYDGTTRENKSMTKVGSGTSVTCNFTTETIDGKTYTYKVFANDNLGNLGNTTYQENIENTKPPTPTHLTPEDEAIMIGNSQNITWTAGGVDAEGDTITYYWRIDDEEPLSAPFTFSGSTTDTNSSQETTVDGTTYFWQIIAGDGYENQTKTTIWNFTENSVPTIDAQSITPETAYTTNNLICTFTVSDAENTSLIVYYKWFNDTEEVISNSKDITSGVEDTVTLDSSYTSKGENWTCEIRPFDGFENGTAQNVTRNITNSNPTITLTAPANNTAITELGNRTPTFTWTSSDDDSDTLAHTIFISDAIDFSNIVDTSSVGTAITYTPTADLDVDTKYWWRVEISDGEIIFNSTDFNFTIESYNAISLINASVLFGEKDIGNKDNTTDDEPYPLVIRNLGNIFVNLTIQALDALWDDPVAGLDTIYFKFKTTEVSGEEGAYNTGSSTTTWTNMPLGATKFIYDFNFSDSTDEARIELYIEVPANEPAGNKNSTISINSLTN
ncbi:MAG: hypothetical protein KKH40_07835 [Nanoarchaeota archaeon]|nr:hypothetical protein [Nanoarchaeota archaeon]